MGKQMHGLLPDQANAVLVVLDMISDFQFPDGTQLQRAARRIAPRIARLKKRAKQAGVACVYINDNPGRWRSDSGALIAHSGKPGSRGAEIVECLRPEASDYFILKPRHSAFYATPLEVLLGHLGARRLILTGVSSHQCVLFTANDAHVRNFEVIVPSDCVASPTPAETRFALHYFRTALGARVSLSTKLRPAALNHAP